MAEYRAYVVEEDGHIRSSRAFVCDDDADATVWAKQLVDGMDIELWSGERFVTRIDHKPELRILCHKAGDRAHTSALEPKNIGRTVGYPTISAELTGYCFFLRPPWSITEFAPRYR